MKSVGQRLKSYQGHTEGSDHLVAVPNDYHASLEAMKQETENTNISNLVFKQSAEQS